MLSLSTLIGVFVVTGISAMIVVGKLRKKRIPESPISAQPRIGTPEQEQPRAARVKPVPLTVVRTPRKPRKKTPDDNGQSAA